MAQIIIYTDGAAQGNPGRGGYGAVLMSGKHRKEISEGFRHTTNNRMELLAVIEALAKIKSDGHQVTIYSDSKYVVDAVEKGWIYGWIKTKFKGKKNSDLWMRFMEQYKRQQVKFVWVKGHANIPENEVCDRLAVAAAQQPSDKLLVDTFYENLENDSTLM